MIGGLSWESSSSSLAESVSVAPVSVTSVSVAPVSVASVSVAPVSIASVSDAPLSVTSVSVTPGVLSVELLAEGGWPQ